MTMLQGPRVFTILDVKNCFWQLTLDEASSYLTTFSTSWGKFGFLVLHFGLNCAAKESHKSMT